MKFYRRLVEDVVDFLSHLLHGEGSALGVGGQGVGAWAHLKGRQSQSGLTWWRSRVAGGGGGGHLGAGVAAFLEAGLATQRGARGGWLVVQAEGGAGHDGGLETSHRTSASAPCQKYSSAPPL